MDKTKGIRVVPQIAEEELASLGVRAWSVWEKEISEFDWYYDSSESCYFIEGEVEVSFDSGSVMFGKGDFVIFPKGLACRWHILQPVRKHYKFD